MSKETKDFVKLLSDPFESTDVKWRVQQSGMTSQSKPWVMLIPYITSRAVEQRLDDVFGVFGWENAFKEARQSLITVTEWVDGEKVKKDKLVNNWLCGITVIDGDKRVTKWDGAEETAIEPFKGGLSGASKRAAVQLGIARYLYHFEVVFVDCTPVDSKWDVSEFATYIEIPLDKAKPKVNRIKLEWLPPPMPEWALPNVKSEALIEQIKNATDLIALRVAFSIACKYANSFKRGDLVMKITEAKDKRKSQLTVDSNKEDEADLMTIRRWLERAVTDEIMSADNESVLKLAKKRLAKGITEKCIDKGLDVVDLLRVLEKYYTNRLAELTRR